MSLVRSLVPAPNLKKQSKPLQLFSCKGFFWSYSLTEPFVIQKDRRKKEVGQYDLDGNQIAIYLSVVEASTIGIAPGVPLIAIQRSAFS